MLTRVTGVLTRKLAWATLGFLWRYIMRSGVNQSLYARWKSMRFRCNDPTNARYGGRGISYDPRWNDYLVFAADVGDPPEGMQLDRIDNNKGYYKDNVRWVTPLMNNNNQGNYKTNTTGLAGVSWHKQKKAWVAYSKAPQQQLYYGPDFFEACCARKSSENKLRLIL